MNKLKNITGAGVGLRREFLREIDAGEFSPDFFEITPENWIHMPYRYREVFPRVMSQFPIIAHGVSLSIGDTNPLNVDFVKTMKKFLDEHKIDHYSEHLSFTSRDGAQSYELLPVPMTEEMARLVGRKAREASEILERPLILENATYYYVPYAEMEETDFINLVLEEANVPMLLDINNVYVNAKNHGFNAEKFIDAIPAERVAYFHVAGHTWYEEDQMIIDTHGREVIDPVWDLLGYTLQRIDAPVLIERDNNIPPLPEIMREYNHLKGILDRQSSQPEKRYA